MLSSVRRRLRLGKVELRLIGCFGTVMAHIFRDADDGDRGEADLRPTEIVEALAERISGKVLLCKGAADDGDGQRGCCVVDGECAATEDGRADVRKVVRGDADDWRNRPRAQVAGA